MAYFINVQWYATKVVRHPPFELGQMSRRARLGVTEHMYKMKLHSIINENKNYLSVPMQECLAL